jgi:hypothetical protein
MIALSYGGGWQSVAMCVLVKEGALPRPDLIGIADTSREIGTTWEYLYGVMQPYLDGIGLKVEVVPHTMAHADLYDKTGLTLMPAWTRTTEIVSGLFGPQEEHNDGRLASYCSGRWKTDVMERWLRLKGVKTCEQWIGYSLDETRRMSKAHREWCQPRYPLIEKRITREMCGRIITGAGLPLPKKSRCFMCPHQTPEEWLEVKARPEEWAAAVQIEKQINESDPRQAGLFLYSGRVPLELANFKGDAGLTPPARHCETAGCWT